MRKIITIIIIFILFVSVLMGCVKKTDYQVNVSSTYYSVTANTTTTPSTKLAATFPPVTTPPVTSPPITTPPTTIEVRSNIDGTFNGWDGDTIFQLLNGQIWIQDSYGYKYDYAYSPSVTILKDGLRYKMIVENVDEFIYVRRINDTDIIRSNINGEFEGFNGNTIFQLLNGQIWEQATYYYYYFYAYSPSVIIIKDGIKYIMIVKGLEDKPVEVRMIS